MKKIISFIIFLLSVNIASAEKLTIVGGNRGNFDVTFSEYAYKNNFLNQCGVEIQHLYTKGGGETLQAVLAEGADIALGVEMQSTGEAACFGDSFYDALSKGLTSVGFNLPDKGTAVVTVGGSANKEKLLPSIAKLKELGFQILATEHTKEFFEIGRAHV